MRIASYLADGVPAFGIVTGDGVVTMNERLSQRHASLQSALAAGALDEMRDVAKKARPDRDFAGLTLLPVIPNPGKTLCVGINYQSHAAEQGAGAAAKPNIFTKFPDVLIGHDGFMVRPKASVEFDYEGELVVVIGRGGRAIPKERALDYVAGYACGCDTSVRDFIKASLLTGKNFPATAPVGPWMVTADEIPDPAKLTLTTRLNGQQVQHSGVDKLIYSVPALIEYISAFTPLAPGDIIFTGTPDGIGAKRTPPLWMKDGDVIEVEISRVGTLRARVVDET
ncbi:MAG: fumarylacetoacetate hydrolase family protein [Candidatus Lustribacter sp.]|jgi:2-keto-4-pentenoate hydratase/2-oxohepta-3-ene-1,7-dioic acid hydratase in catechol pathway